MFKVNVTYEDFNGNQYEESLYFNMTRVEFMRWSAEEGSNLDLAEKMKNAVEKNDFSKIMQYFEDLIRLSYGEKSDDGKRFIKDPEKTKNFMTSPAYDELFWRITQDQEQCKAFISGVIPKIEKAAVVNANSTTA